MKNEWLTVEEQRNKKVKRIIQGDKEDEEETGGKCEVGLYGYRRQVLCLVLLCLIFLVVLNIGLSLWMLKVMEFSSAGLGPLTILRRGIQLHGQAIVLDKLIASKITSRSDKPIRIESSQGITLMSRSYTGDEDRPYKLHNKLVLADDKLQVYGSGVLISDHKGRVLFSADRKEVLVGAKQLKVTGEGGAVFHGSVQTPLVRASAGQELRLESPTRSLHVFALHGVGVESRAGDISATCLDDFDIQSKAGSIKLDAQNVYMSKLPAAQAPGQKLPAAGEKVVDEEEDGLEVKKVGLRAPPEVFQLCICGGKGRVFLAPAEGPCIAEEDICR